MLRSSEKLVCQAVILTALLFSLTACALFPPRQEVVIGPAPTKLEPAKPVLLLPSAQPLSDVPKDKIVYAQNALNKLGYTLGPADGIWGPKSARAIREFEQANNLESARGHLSELNLSTLEKITKLTRGSQATPIIVNEIPLSARVDASVPLEGAPQLVIIEKTRALMAKPNPYSEVISRLSTGTVIYVIGVQEGWYEVESEGQIRGYLKAN